MKAFEASESAFCAGAYRHFAFVETVVSRPRPARCKPTVCTFQLAMSGAGSVAGIIYNAISGIDAALWDILGNR